ncbi:MAG: hypothetical protein ACYC6N_20575 [Pirellulaceae bacterium]
MRRRLVGLSLTTSLLLLTVALGCGDSGRKSSSVDRREPSAADAKGGAHGHDHAQQEFHTFTEGVTALREHYEEIKAAFTQGDAAKAHEPLHHVGSVLEALPELGKTAGLSASDLEKLNQAVQDMFEAYGTIDDALHQNKEADYQAVAEQLDQSMTVIRSLDASPSAVEQ